MNIVEKLQWRYATKKFDPTKKLSVKKLEILKQAFNLTATSFGLQTITMLIVSDMELRKALVKHAYNQKQVLEASHLLIICVQDNITDADIDKFFDNTKSIRRTPDEILDPYRNNLKKMMQKMTIEERQRWSLNQAYIALGNLMTVCAVEEIDSCPMEGFSEKQFDDILNLKSKNLKSVLLLPVGHRADDDFFANLKKVRKSVAESTIEM